MQKDEMAELIKSLRKPPPINKLALAGIKLEYSGWMDESMSWKETCYVGDWSFRGMLHGMSFKGPDALKMFSYLCVNSFAKFDIGQAKHAIMCNNDGKLIMSGILMRISTDEVYFQHWPQWPQYNAEKGSYDVTCKPTDLFGWQVSGPNALYVVEKVCGESIRDIEFMHFRNIKIKGHDIICLRQCMAGELGWELEGPMEHYQEVLDAIWEAGQEFGIRRLGRRTGSMNHLEAGIAQSAFIPGIYGDDMKDYYEWLKTNYPTMVTEFFRISGSFDSDDINDYYRSPVELGWTSRIKFDHEFIGRKALESEVANPEHSWVALEWNAEDVIDVYASIFRKGEHYDFMDIPMDFQRTIDLYKVLKDGKLVGVALSRGYSYYFRKMISHCIIEVAYSKPATEVTVVWGAPGHMQKNIRAIVSPSPYKKDRRREDVTKLPSYLKNYPGKI